MHWGRSLLPTIALLTNKSYTFMGVRSERGNSREPLFTFFSRDAMLAR